MPGPQGRSKKAPLVGAFFVFVSCCAPLLAAPCDAPGPTRQVSVRHVSDGDTLILSDDSRIRLIGLNSPEMGKDGRPAEPLAIRARDRLRQLLFQQGNRLEILPGIEKKDRHGRLLAHAWLPDGDNVAATLIGQGLGWFVAVPPNVRLTPCYQQAENAARRAKRGIWEKPAYEIRASDSLKLRDSGFHVVRGPVVRVGRGGGATWVNLKGRFAVRIPDHARQWFNNPPDETWVGRELEVRGWVYQAKGELRVNIGHPAALAPVRPATQ